MCTRCTSIKAVERVSVAQNRCDMDNNIQFTYIMIIGCMDYMNSFMLGKIYMYSIDLPMDSILWIDSDL